MKLILAHGDVQIALKSSPAAFEDGWYDWMVSLDGGAIPHSESEIVWIESL